MEEEYPECPICYDIYGINQNHIKAPKVLKCGDTICKECLENIIKKSDEEFFKCPLCQEEVIKYQSIDDYTINKEIIRLVNAFFNLPKEENENGKEKNKPISYKIISLGSTGVGKTSIFERIKTENFNEGYNATINVEISVPYYVKYKNNRYKLFFYDTCGQESFMSQLPKNYLRHSDGALFVYDITNEESFKDLEKWYKLYSEEKENVVGVLIGNKCDISEEHRKVNFDDAQKFANEKGLKYLEISAKLDKKVKKAIAKLLKEIIESKALYNSLSSLDSRSTQEENFQLDPKMLEKESFCSRFCKKINPKNWL